MWSVRDMGGRNGEDGLWDPPVLYPSRRQFPHRILDIKIVPTLLPFMTLSFELT